MLPLDFVESINLGLDIEPCKSCHMLFIKDKSIVIYCDKCGTHTEYEKRKRAERAKSLSSKTDKIYRRMNRWLLTSKNELYQNKNMIPLVLKNGAFKTI